MPEPPTEVHHHHYIPIKGWVFQKGNYVMVQFQTEVSDSEIEAAFTSPSSGSTIDTALVEHLKTLPKGKAIKLPKDNISDRSLKVRVNKAAKLANRRLGWAEVSDGFLARVVEILTPSSNGVVTPEVTSNGTTEATQEATTEVAPEAVAGRNRNR
jgi:hypothetical protein